MLTSSSVTSNVIVVEVPDQLKRGRTLVAAAGAYLPAGGNFRRTTLYLGRQFLRLLTRLKAEKRFYLEPRRPLVYGREE